MATQQPIHICFISKRCAWSKAFLEELSKTPYRKEFNVIVYEDNPRSKLPAWLEKTPTLVIRGEKEPRTDAEVMNWLYERKLREPSQQQQQQGSSQQPKKGGDPASSLEPEAWSSSEFGVGLYSSSGTDSSYSFINSDTNTGGNGGSTLPGSFSFLNGQAATGQRSVDLYPGGAGGEKKTKREQMFDSQMEEYMKYRDQGMPKGPPRV